MPKNAIFIAATGQHVGKTTLCLGLLSALQKKFSSMGFIKPVGQQHETVEGGLKVDKDVVLFKEYFNLDASYAEMSPVIFPSGFTRNYLDGKIDGKDLFDKIVRCFNQIHSSHAYTIVEGTGNIGVGSIVNLNNADVAARLGLDIVILAKGGLGSAFDELALNKSLCDRAGVKIKGVILNRVYDEKREMIIEYMQKALARWQIPLMGCIPFNRFLNTPSLEDFEKLFNTSLLAGEKHHYQHFETIRLIASSVETVKELSFPNQLIITPATREDVIHLLVNVKSHSPASKEPEYGLILTGVLPPSTHLIETLKKAEIPTIYAAQSSFEVMRMITSFTAKIRKEDISKVKEAIEHVENNIDISILLS